ncbi:zinc transporter ZupT [Porphyromonas sp. COT-239 OH1446]|uniref:zinc transporter ZupT n=1 Tax=Porphyromonas sp. COT-239 OH1446 TaxID=1515613 RepID=UPI00052DC86C|nr:zinc transporter ZupT [Porphyromonas sp. COT-239 OH1446]KGN71999.1 zinc transporter ZupT [Porphyromonas sp. COT-239 OH1446]
MTNTILVAFLLTLFAGLSTGIGSAIAFFARRTNTSFLSAALGFSAGVMIYISFVELLATSSSSLSGLYGERLGTTYATLAFFAGVLLIMLIDKFVPSAENPHELHKVEDMSRENRDLAKNSKLLRVGMLSALTLAIHNFPEGMVTFLAGMENMSIALPIAIAIAIHNIPEGISVSVPIFYATGDRKKAFWLSFLSGLAEPLGALIGYLILAPFINEAIMGLIFAIIAGIMVFISLDELLPAAKEYGEHHWAIYGLVAGMAVMAFSLILFS